MGLLLLLPSAWCAEVSTAMDKLLHLELHWHAELVGVAVAVVENFMVGLDAAKCGWLGVDFCLSVCLFVWFGDSE